MEVGVKDGHLTKVSRIVAKFTISSLIRATNRAALST
jgi:hypothetical protein